MQAINLYYKKIQAVTKTKLAIIIPTYNEKENLPQLIQRIETAMSNQDHEIIIVDDNSPDGTGQLAEQLAKQYGNIKVIHRPAKMGLATAILEGIKHAEGDIIAVMDADLQHPPELLPKLHQAILKGNDIAIASRYIEGGKIEDWSLKRKIISKGAIALAHLFLPQTRKIKDIMSGYFALRKDLLQDIELNPTGYKILLEIVAKTKPKKIAEIPYTFKPRSKGKSKLGTKEIFNYVKHLVRLYIESKECLRLLKFCIVGLSGVILSEFLLWLLTETIKLHYMISATFTSEIVIISNFIGDELWTFRDRRNNTSLKGILKRLVSFNATRIVGMFLGLIMLAFFTEVVGFYYLISNLVSIAIVTLWDYLTSSQWIWT